jgi:hypothetical protein
MNYSKILRSTASFTDARSRSDCRNLSCLMGSHRGEWDSRSEILKTCVDEDYYHFVMNLVTEASIARQSLGESSVGLAPSRSRFHRR